MPRYLDGFAEPEACHPADFIPPGDYGHAVVIPACGEGENLDRAIDSVPPGRRGVVLVVVVINARGDHPASVHAANAAALTRLRDRTAEPPHRRVVVIDRASAGRWIPPRQGVGLARKIGHDVAFALHAIGRLRSPFMHSTDADALLPADYFDRLANLEDQAEAPAGVVYPYRHRPEEVAAETCAAYEIKLRLHHLGLASAGSPYAYPSIGSTIAINHRAYGAVRGIPKRVAGEDFYLLDKLAKVGEIERLGGPPLILAGRISDRVPFGTGRALIDLTASGTPARELPVLAPRTYRMLSAWLGLLREPPSPGGDPAAALSLMAARAGLGGRETAGLIKALEAMGALDALSATLAQRLPRQVEARRLMTGFDAFETLRLLHVLRDSGWPTLPVLEAVVEMDFFGGIALPPRAELEAIAERLAELEESNCRYRVGLLRSRFQGGR